jgi:DNA-binding CsgD family transcriptional regulator
MVHRAPRAHTRANLGVVRRRRKRKETRLLPATTTVEDFDRFNSVFGTKGAEKRRQHGSKGALVFRDRAREVIERRAGGAYDPQLAALATDHLDELLDGLDDALIWEQAIAAEPPPQRWMTGEEIDAAFRVVGTFTDLKSYWLRGHAEGTSQLAEAAAWRLGLPEDEVTIVRRAALALDLGRVAVSNAIWEKPGAFGLTDWERVPLHPYFTERSFAHAPGLASIGELAGAHHERLNGAGYHRKTPAPGLGRAARILAAVDAVLAAAGHRVAKRPRELPAGLTDRELEVLLALAAGQTNKEIAETLGISAKTAGHHVQHILDKTGARTRTAATVWAFERHLV